MNKMKGLDDTIVAISTASGQGGISIVRLSGAQAVAIADRMIKTKNGRKPSTFKSFSVHHGWVVNKGAADEHEEIIDEALVTVMRAPKSYTKEDVIEISCHGSRASLRAIVTLATELGARCAEPGEFTKRAFLNGRIDLTQAEAVLDIIESKTDAFLRVSTQQLKGDLSLELESIREKLMEIYVEIEAIVNFPEDDIDARGRNDLIQKIEAAKQRVEKLLRSGQQGRILKEGIKIVLCGKPNVGKSSLLNVLLKQPRAIVSSIAGTTRDTIEETAEIQGIPFQLVDTAGILEPRDIIEEEAVRRSHTHIKGADLVLLIIDSSQPLNNEDKKLMDSIAGQNTMLVLNKSDLASKVDEKMLREKFPLIVKVSALHRTGIDALGTAIVQYVWQAKTIDTTGIMISNIRHLNALQSCADSLTKAQQHLTHNLSLEFISEEIKGAVNFLDNITGRNIDSDLLENIFSRFCIGK